MEEKINKKKRNSNAYILYDVHNGKPNHMEVGKLTLTAIVNVYI